MALFGLFGKKDDAAEIKKLVARATAKFGPPENRAAALERLVDMKTPEAYAALLQRFTVRVEPGITDDDEKKYVYDSLVAAGTDAVAPIKAYIEKAEQPTWAIRALEQIVPHEEVVETVLSALEREGAAYARDPEKKVILLRYLEQFDDERIGPRVVPFLQEDPSEDVQAAAVGVLAARAHESAREPLINALLRAHAGSSERLRRAVAEALVKTAFSVKGQTPAVQEALPEGFTVDKQGVVKAK